MFMVMIQRGQLKTHRMAKSRANRYVLSALDLPELNVLNMKHAGSL